MSIDMDLKGRIINMQVYYGDWDNKEHLERDFEITLDQDIEILFAKYTYGNYNGEALVVYRQGDKLFEVNGYHCSCKGLEGQWEPEETSIEALAKRNVEIPLDNIIIFKVQ